MMTTMRPGKYPAVRKEELSLIDVSLEDDSLLPSSASKMRPANAGDSKENVPVYPQGVPETQRCDEMSAVLQENLSLNRGTLFCAIPEKQSDMQSPISTQEPALVKKKKRTGHFNLRKSLAWNNAFFTDEGVLDPEELSLVNKTFKRPPDLPRPIVHKKHMGMKKIAESSGIPNADFSSSPLDKSVFTVHTPRVESNSGQGQGSSLTLSSPRSSTGSIGSISSITGSGSERLEQHGNKAKVLAETRHAVATPSLRVQAEPLRQTNTNIKPLSAAGSGSSESKSLLSKKSIDNSTQKGTRLRLPSSFAGKKAGEKTTEEVQKIATKQFKGALVTSESSPSSLSNFSRKVSCASRKMKDRLGKVLPGLGSSRKGSPVVAQDDSLISACSPTAVCPDALESAKVTRCYSYTPFERFGRPISEASPEAISSNSDFCPEPASNEGGSQRPIHAGGGGTLSYRAKPSGLRMPSPKLGFFDTARAITAPQVPALPERSGGFGLDGAAVQAGRNAYSSRFFSDRVGTTYNSQQSAGFKPHGSSTRSFQQSPEASGLRIRGTLIPSGIPSAPHLRGPETTSKSSSSVSTPILAGSSNPSSTKGLCNRRHIMQVKKDQECASSREDVHTKSPFLINDATSKRLNLGTNSLENKREDHHSSTELEASSGQMPVICSGGLPTGMAVPMTSLREDIHTKSLFLINDGTSKMLNLGTNSLENKREDHHPSTESEASSGQMPVICSGGLSTGTAVSMTSSREDVHTKSPFLINDATSRRLILGTNSLERNREDHHPGTESEAYSGQMPVICSGGLFTGTAVPMTSSREDVHTKSPFLIDDAMSRRLNPGANSLENKREDHHPSTESEASSGQMPVICFGGLSIEVPMTSIEEQQEWLQMKSGAVQHSPPDKTSPKPGPWSPVRRNGQQLGPFDCTKCMSTSISH